MKRKGQVQNRRQLPPSQQMPNLPTEIIEEILSRLPVDSLFRFRCVSKYWYHLVKDPHFIKMQLGRAKENPRILIAYRYGLFSAEFGADDRTSVVDFHPPSQGLIHVQNSCNGLVCYVVEEEIGAVYVWNPFTRDYKKLPDIQSNDWGFFRLGYSPAMEEYKVVRLSPDTNEVWVHTLGTLSWRRAECVPSGIHLTYTGVYLNGALHWIAIRNRNSHVILVFDLRDEKFREMLLPDYGNNNRIVRYRIMVLGGHLSVHGFTYISCREDGCEIWVMKEYGNEKSWSKQILEIQKDLTKNFFPIPIRILGSTKSGEILIARNKWFALFNPVDQSIRMLPICARSSPFEANIYVESLVSPVVDV